MTSRSSASTSSFIEARVRRDAESVLIQWARESAYRFFPLVRHDHLGLVLHPYDLATGKVLALVGRVESRDFVDTLACDREIQPLGYLAWAACGKDPGFSPLSILEHAARSVRYSQAELSALRLRRPGRLTRATCPGAGTRHSRPRRRSSPCCLPRKQGARC